jgi:hypothetical protein
MPMRSLAKKLKFGKFLKTRMAPRWVDIKKFGLKRARTRRMRIFKKRWRRGRIKV